MLSINVTNPIIQRLLLEHVIETIETENGIDSLLQSGCSPEFIDTIRHRQARDLINVASSLKTMRFSISPKEVLNELQHLDRVRRDAELREYFIINRAPRSMLNKDFKMSADEVRRLRELLLPEGAAPAGRTPLPPLKVRDQIHEAWSVINKQFTDEPQRERMYRLHQQFQTLTIDTLCQTIDEFGDLVPPTRSAVQAALATRSTLMARSGPFPSNPSTQIGSA